MGKQSKADSGQTLQNSFAFNVIEVHFPNKNVFWKGTDLLFELYHFLFYKTIGEKRNLSNFSLF